jgi:hypothetical protein
MFGDCWPSGLTFCTTSFVIYHLATDHRSIWAAQMTFGVQINVNFYRKARPWYAKNDSLASTNILAALNLGESKP